MRIEYEVLLTEAELADEFVAALVARRLPEKFFYWFPLSVKAWLALCTTGAGAYRNYERSRSLLNAHAEDLVSHLRHPGPVEVVSLGAGQGDKDRLVLEALKGRGRVPTYVPVDSSQALLELAAQTAHRAGYPVRAVKADLTRAEHLSALRPPDAAPQRLALLLGNTLGGFDPLELAVELRSLLRDGDRLVVDGELFDSAETLAGYDNPVNRRFAFAPLASIGITERDGTLVFEPRDDPRMPGLHLIPKHFRLERDLTLMVGGEPLRLQEGERLDMNHSYKYARDTFFHILHQARLRPEADWLSADGRFVMALVAPQ